MATFNKFNSFQPNLGFKVKKPTGAGTTKPLAGSISSFGSKTDGNKFGDSFKSDFGLMKGTGNPKTFNPTISSKLNLTNTSVPKAEPLKSFTTNTPKLSFNSGTKFDDLPGMDGKGLGTEETPGGGMDSAASAATVGLQAGLGMIDASAERDLLTARPGQGVYGTQKTDTDALGKKATTSAISTGGAIGGTIGGIVGSVIPVVGTAVGGFVGTGLGSLIGWAFGNKKAGEVKKDATDEFNKAELIAKNTQDRKRNAQQYKSVYSASHGMRVPTILVEKPNMIVDGKLHRENNGLGKRDKGIPVIDKAGNKIIEVERDEWVLNPQSAEKLTRMSRSYKKTKNDDILVAMGKQTVEEMLEKTKDATSKFDKIQ